MTGTRLLAIAILGLFLGACDPAASAPVPDKSTEQQIQKEQSDLVDKESKGG